MVPERDKRVVVGGGELREEGQARGSWWKAEREEATPHGERRRGALKG